MKEAIYTIMCAKWSQSLSLPESEILIAPHIEQRTATKKENRNSQVRKGFNTRWDPINCAFYFHRKHFQYLNGEGHYLLSKKMMSNSVWRTNRNVIYLCVQLFGGDKFFFCENLSCCLIKVNCLLTKWIFSSDRC